MEQQQQKTVEFKYDHPIIMEMESKYRAARAFFYLTIMYIFITFIFDIPFLKDKMMSVSIFIATLNVLYFARLILCMAKQFVAIMKADYIRKLKAVDEVLEN